MSECRFDVAVVGAGPVGLAAAIAFAKAGCRTILVGPAPARRDGRTAALLASSVEFLASIDVWDALAPMAGALRTLRIVDDSGSLFRPPPVSFRAAEIGLEAFGWNVENNRLTDVLAEAARHQVGLSWHDGLADGFEAAECARVMLTDGAAISASLVVAADGRRSRVREAAGIRSSERSYPQTAFTTLLRHEQEHDDVSTEFHTRSGPFTLVPLPGRRSSLVWVTVPLHAERLSRASEPDLARAIEVASHSVLGRIDIDGPRGLMPLGSMSVESYVGARLALAGEAAHVLPPIGAQGLNLGFGDAAALAALVEDARRDGRDLGEDSLLARYARDRSPAVRMRSTAVDGLNRALLSRLLPVDAVRGLGLGLLGQFGPLRRAVMRAGVPRDGGSATPSRETGRAGSFRS